MTETALDITAAEIEEDLRIGDKRHGPHFVVVKVDGVDHNVRRGRYIVSDFKRLVGVDPTYQLDEVVNGQFVELKDTEKISIKGKEVFVSHVRGGAAS